MATDLNLKLLKTALAGAAAAAMFGSAPVYLVLTMAPLENAVAAPTANEPGVIRNGTIGYVLTSRRWATYTTPDGKTECPNGFNDGPREQFKQLFPDDRAKRTLLQTELMREGRQWFPSTEPEPFTFKEVTGRISYGLNLDGKVKDTDFTSPEGEPGIDNQLYRAVGCISDFRIVDNGAGDEYIHRYAYNRLLVEISGVHSLINDDNVTVKTYRGLDELMTDGTGSAFIPGGTQHIDKRWGRFVESTWKGKIVDGVLISEPADMILPAAQSFGTTGLQRLRAVRFRLKLTDQTAQGLMAGYVDVDEFIHQLNTGESTHIQSYGQLSSPSLYRALRRLADGYPDPKTGEMTAISSALQVKFVQAYIIHASEPAAPNRDAHTN
jgi:hypothetical protein